MTPENDRLEAALAAAGARIDLRRCGEIAVDFGGGAAEYAALRHGCGLLDPRMRALVCAAGEDRATFLQGMLSNDVLRCPPGGGIAAAILTVQARVVTDLRVFVLGNSIWLDFPAQRRTVGIETLERYIVADDVELSEPDLVPLAVLEGRRAADVVSTALAIEADQLVSGQHREVGFGATTLRLLAVTHSGEPGYLVVGPAACATSLWRAAREAGAVPTGWDALEVARVEAGIPAMDADMDESYLAPEVGLHDAVSTKKGCYIGQEIVERVSSRGNVQRRLVGLKFENDEPLPAGASLVFDGKEVGHVTSSVISPTLGCVIGLGYARRSAWAPGTHLVVAGDGKETGATVAAVPLVGTA